MLSVQYLIVIKTTIMPTNTGFQSIPTLYLFWGVLVVIIIFLLVREFWLWYWKINKIVSLLEEITRNTNKDSNSSQQVQTKQ